MSAAQALAAVATLGPVSPAIAAAYALGYADATAAAAAVARPTIVSSLAVAVYPCVQESQESPRLPVINTPFF